MKCKLLSYLAKNFAHSRSIRGIFLQRPFHERIELLGDLRARWKRCNSRLNDLQDEGTLISRFERMPKGTTLRNKKENLISL